MDRFERFSYVVDSEIIYEIESINKKNKDIFSIKSLAILNVLIVATYLYDLFISNILVVEFNIYVICIFEFLFLIGFMLPFYIFNSAKKMKLVFTRTGVAISPCQRIFKIPINCVSETWENIDGFSFFKLSNIMKIGSDPSRQWVLNIRTSGILQKFVNNYGISVFAISGHHMNEKEREIVIEIFQSFNVRQEI